MSRNDDLRQQAWDYFALHAQQRLTTIKFYLVIATTLTAAAVASFGENFQFPGLRLLAGFLLSLLSYAFWRLDFRNRELIKAAEAALRSFEAGDRIHDGGEEPPVEWLFTREQRQSEECEEASRLDKVRDPSHLLRCLPGVVCQLSFCRTPDGNPRYLLEPPRQEPSGLSGWVVVAE